MFSSVEGRIGGFSTGASGQSCQCRAVSYFVWLKPVSDRRLSSSFWAAAKTFSRNNKEQRLLQQRCQWIIKGQWAIQNRTGLGLCLVSSDGAKKACLLRYVILCTHSTRRPIKIQVFKPSDIDRIHRPLPSLVLAEDVSQTCSHTFVTFLTSRSSRSYDMFHIVHRLPLEWNIRNLSLNITAPPWTWSIFANGITLSCTLTTRPILRILCPLTRLYVQASFRPPLPYIVLCDVRNKPKNMRTGKVIKTTKRNTAFLMCLLLSLDPARL